MDIINLELNKIKEYEKNPRKNDEAVKYVAESIKNFGFKVPIVIDKDNIIIAGHTRYKASKKLGLKEVPCIIADDLTEEQIKAFRLADNKVSEKAKWDKTLLDFELADINLDMSLFGFDNLFEEDKEQPEIEFTESLEESHNYLVLYFDNEIDWLQAQTLFDIKTIKEYSTRKDGSIKKERTGIGRVLNGSSAINKILGGSYEDINQLS